MLINECFVDMQVIHCRLSLSLFLSLSLSLSLSSFISYPKMQKEGDHFSKRKALSRLKMPKSSKHNHEIKT